MSRRVCSLLAAIVLVVGLAACSGGGDDNSSDVTAAPLGGSSNATNAPATTTTTAATFDPGSDGGSDSSSSSGAGAGEATIDNFATEAGITDQGDAYSDFEQVSDDSGQIFMEVPSEFDDRDTSASSDGNPSILASPDLGGDSDTTPLIGYTAVQFSTPPDLDDLLSQSAAASTAGECDAEAPGDYADGVFSGRVQVFVNCGGQDRAWLFVAATPDNGDSYAVVVFGQAITVADVDAVQHAFDTFNTNV